MTPVVAGMAVGAGAAVISTRLLSTILFAVEPNDLPTLILIAVLLALVAFIGCVIPERRAIRIDPIKALRNGMKNWPDEGVRGLRCEV